MVELLPVKQKVAGSSPAGTAYAVVAQWGKFMEVWKDLPGHDGYSVSSEGRIKRKDTGKIYNGMVNNKGYVRFDLSENGKRFVVHGHRAVAEAFIPKCKSNLVVNHLNGKKSDNRVGNLEWCTPRDNSLHSTRVLGNGPYNAKPVMHVETGNVYISIREAVRKTGISEQAIIRSCNGKVAKPRKGHWKYVVVV